MLIHIVGPTGMDSTIERNTETGGRKGELHLDTRIWGNDSISKSTKKSMLVL